MSLINAAKYSVLLSVYEKEKPQNLYDSVQSMLNQTVPPDEIVLVKDGPLTEPLEKVIIELASGQVIKTISLPENMGLGRALRIGVLSCKNDIVARMDTDDIALPSRCEKQLEVFARKPGVSVVGTAVAEFDGITRETVCYKGAPSGNAGIRRIMKYRNPMNHPTVMFKKADVLAAGNYDEFDLNEDYYLWVRMMQKGFEFENLDEPLVKMRTTNDTYSRRGGLGYFLIQKRLFDYMLETGFINIFEHLFNNAIRFFSRILTTNRMRRYLYIRLLRRKA